MMAWTDEFNDVAWANGDYLSEIKLDQMVANERWNHDQISVVNLPAPDDYPLLFDGNKDVDSDNSVSTSFVSWTFELLINTTVIYSSQVFSDPGWVSVRSINTGNAVLTPITSGTMFDLSFRWKKGVNVIGQYGIELVRNQALNYLTFGFDWGIGYFEGSPTDHYRRAVWRNVWLVGHEETETW